MSSECDYGLHVVIFMLIVSAKETVPSPRKPDLSGIPEGTLEAGLKNLPVGKKKEEDESYFNQNSGFSSDLQALQQTGSVTWCA